MRTLSTLFLMLLTVCLVQVQAQPLPDPEEPQGQNLDVPEGWEFRLDQPDPAVRLSADPETDGIYFVNMTPGWHLTTGPRGIFWHPAYKVSGSYTLSTELHLFNPNGRNREGFGLFFGGKNMNSDDYEYLYFLIRNTGDFLIKQRQGESTETIQGWTASEAIKLYDDPEVSSVLNRLAIEVNGDTMKFFINSEEVATINANDLKLDTNGMFGLRVNHAVNLHIEDLGVRTE